MFQTALLHFWEKTAHAMSGIQTVFQGHVQYQFTTLKVANAAQDRQQRVFVFHLTLCCRLCRTCGTRWRKWRTWTNKRRRRATRLATQTGEDVPR